jgi:hypothetical protein
MYLIQEAIKVVKSINESMKEDIPKQYKETEFLSVNAVTDGTDVYIEYLGACIWQSIDDEREFSYDDDSYEPLEPYIRKKIMDIIDEIAYINLNRGKDV